MTCYIVAQFTISMLHEWRLNLAASDLWALYFHGAIANVTESLPTKRANLTAVWRTGDEKNDLWPLTSPQSTVPPSTVNSRERCANHFSCFFLRVARQRGQCVLTSGRTVIIGCCFRVLFLNLNLLLQTHGNFNYVFSVTVRMLVIVTVTRHFCALSPFFFSVACLVSFWA